MSRFQPATRAQVFAIDDALVALLTARAHALQAKCPRFLKRIRLAISSGKGAQRHIWNRYTRTVELRAQAKAARAAQRRKSR